MIAIYIFLIYSTGSENYFRGKEHEKFRLEILKFVRYVTSLFLKIFDVDKKDRDKVET